MISEFLFYDEHAPKDEKTNYVNLKIEIRELLNHPFNRKVLIDVLMDLRKDLSGATLDKLFELYESLGLHHDSYKKLESWRWQAISKGISELTQMHVEESYVFVTKFINDKRSTIRKQAEIAIITLKPEGLNFFLDTTTYRISEWQQLKILEVLKNKKNYQPPSFKQWLTSKNKDVVLFALRLMKHYNQTDGNKALIELLKHKNGEIKVAAIVCIKEFYVVEALETLKLVFWNSSVDIKIGILDAIATLGSNVDIEFLRSVGVKDSNFNVKSKALASINAIAPMSVMPTIGIQKVNSFKVPKDIIINNPNEVEEDLSVQLDDSESMVSHDIDPERAKDQQEEEDVELVEDEPGISEEPSNESLKTIKTEGVLPEKELTKEKPEPQQEVSKNPVYGGDSPRIETDSAEDEYNFKVDFLPFVTPKEKDEIVERYQPSREDFSESATLTEFELIYEVVLPKSQEAENSSAHDIPPEIENEFDFRKEPISLDFLPLVVSSEEIIAKTEIQQEEKPLDLLGLEVVYTEMEINPPKENKILSELNALVPLPRLPKIKTKEKKNVSQESKEPSSTHNIDMKKIRKIECEGVEIKIEKQEPIKEEKPILESEISEELQNFAEQEELSTLDWILAENEAQVELKQKIKSIAADQEDIAYKLPKPIFYDERGVSTIALLDDIEALGDRREVPLLETMLLEEEEASLRERIQFLIEKISDTSVLKRESIPESTEVFSVFEEFFVKVDIPSQLILLDEIVVLGDEKEIPFLRRLATSSDKKLRKKAGICLEKLTARLVKESNEQPTAFEEKTQEAKGNDPKIISESPENNIEKPFSVFDIDFDLSLENLEEPETKPRT